MVKSISLVKTATIAAFQMSCVYINVAQKLKHILHVNTMMIDCSHPQLRETIVLIKKLITRSLTECSGVNNFTIIRDSAEYPNSSIILLLKIRYVPYQ